MSRRIEDLHPEMQIKCKEFLDLCVKTKVPMIVVFTHRSFEEQALLYAKGRTLEGPRVTNARPGYSWHNFRRAFDVAFYRNSGISWDGPWEMVGDLGKGIGLVWGGDFITFPDRPHFEYHPDLTLEQVRLHDMTLRVV